MTHGLTATLLLALVLGHAGDIDAQAPVRQLDLRFDANGDVWLKAQHVSLRDLMAEWARQCGCRVVNADRLSNVPTAVPLEFQGSPQSAVLEALLRPVPGYVLTPLRAAAAGPSQFETIYLVAESTANAGAAPTVATPLPRVLPTPGAPEDEIPPVRPLPAQTDPAKPASPPSEGPAATPAPKPPGVSVPAVRIVPVTR